MNKIPGLMMTAFLMSGCASIPQRIWTAPLYYNAYLQEQGAFVEYPTVAGLIVGMPTMPVGVALMPFLEPETGEGAGWGLALLCPSIVASITGTPFLVLRRTLWDFPRWCFQSIRNVDPPNAPQ